MIRNLLLRIGLVTLKDHEWMMDEFEDTMSKELHKRSRAIIDLMDKRRKAYLKAVDVSMAVDNIIQHMKGSANTHPITCRAKRIKQSNDIVLEELS
jgi:hypothetical protein